MYTPAAPATTISSVCFKCATIGKSGKRTCCGRGGSWFRNCGSAGNAKLHHTWYEGIRACKILAQSKTAISHQLNADQEKGIASSDDAVTHTKGVLTTNNSLVPTSANKSTVRPDTHHIMASATASTAYDIDTANSKTIDVTSTTKMISTPPYMSSSMSSMTRDNTPITVPALRLVTNPSTNTLRAAVARTSASKSIVTPGYNCCYSVTIHMILICFILF